MEKQLEDSLEEVKKIQELGKILSSKKSIIYILQEITSRKYPAYIGEQIIGYRAAYPLAQRANAKRKLKEYSRSLDEEVRKSARVELKKPRINLCQQQFSEYIEKHPYADLAMWGAGWFIGSCALLGGLIYLANKLKH